MTKAIQTSERTFNKTIKAQVVELMPTAKTFKKLHVAGFGYVYFIKDQDQNTLAKVYKETLKGMKILIN